MKWRKTLKFIFRRNVRRPICPSTIVFIWIPGHTGYLERDAVDLTAKQETSLASIMDKHYLLDIDYKSYYHLFISTFSWEILLEYPTIK